jgi:hypothetical protein
VVGVGEVVAVDGDDGVDAVAEHGSVQAHPVFVGQLQAGLALGQGVVPVACPQHAWASAQ